jgi:hypothetical protein
MHQRWKNGHFLPILSVSSDEIPDQLGRLGLKHLAIAGLLLGHPVRLEQRLGEAVLVGDDVEDDEASPGARQMALTPLTAAVLRFSSGASMPYPTHFSAP